MQFSRRLYVDGVQRLRAVYGEDSDFAFFLIVNIHLRSPYLYSRVVLRAQVCAELIAGSKHHLPSGEASLSGGWFYLRGISLRADFNRSLGQRQGGYCHRLLRFVLPLC
jgi:hypothetical protein